MTVASCPGSPCQGQSCIPAADPFVGPCLPGSRGCSWESKTPGPPATPGLGIPALAGCPTL